MIHAKNILLLFLFSTVAVFLPPRIQKSIKKPNSQPSNKKNCTNSKITTFFKTQIAEVPRPKHSLQSKILLNSAQWEWFASPGELIAEHWQKKHKMPY